MKTLIFRLKDVFAVKNFAIALSWAITGSFLPLAISPRSFIQIALVFYFLFLRCIVNTTTFDIRDIEGDRISGVRSIPVAFGVEKTRKILLLLNSTLIPWLAYSYFLGLFHTYLLVLIFAIAYGYWYILHFCRDGIKIGKSLDLLVDGEWILIATLATVFTLL
jgi:4-hydroxybenzoate polyprenyltransferase